MAHDDTLVDKDIKRLKNRRWIARIIVLATIVIGIASFTGALKDLRLLLFPPTEEVLILGGNVQQPTEWDYANRIVRLKGSLVTNGYPLTIRARHLIADSASIKSFPDDSASRSGDDGDPGKNGKSGSGEGGAGGRGNDGEAGNPGLNGTGVGAIVIEARKLSGALFIGAPGKTGGNGGKGGAGGRGGNGTQGSPSQSGRFDCTNGPGWGGRGGDGGNGANGGGGGNGGSGASVTLTVSKSISGKVLIEVPGGSAGVPGLGGYGGEGGSGGGEGTSTGWCRPSGRNGPPGNVGQVGGRGPAGMNGQAGEIIVRLPRHQEQKVVGKYAYQGSPGA